MLRTAPAGRRFQASYEQNRRVGPHSVLRRAIRLLLAGLAFALGLIEMFLPGPALLFFAVAGALLSTESKTVARLLDATELRARAALRWLGPRWRRLPGAARATVATVAVALTVAAGYGAYRIWAG